MKSIKKVLWEEGTFLTPQYFQQWDRYHDAVLRERVGGLQPFAWGIGALEVDTAALEGGMFAVRGCSGIFRDGFFFDTERRDLLPASRSFLELYEASKGQLGVHLGIAKVSEAGIACAEAGATETITPFVKSQVVVADDLRVHSEAPVQTAETNLRILFDGEALGDFETLKIAEVVKSGAGAFALRTDYAPPCVAIQASGHLMDGLRDIVEVLGRRAADIAGKRRDSGGLGEVVHYQRLLSIHQHYPRLAHFHTRPRVHPETVFLELASLAAEQAALDVDRTLRDVPVYDHENLGEVFTRLRAMIVPSDAGTVRSDFVLLDLVQRGPTRIATVEPTDLLQTAEFYLGIESDLTDERLVQELPRQIKLSSPTKMQEILIANLPGLAVRHAPVLPTSVSIRAGRTYFQFQRSGTHWDAIEESHQIAISLPAALQVRQVELYAVPR